MADDDLGGARTNAAVLLVDVPSGQVTYVNATAAQLAPGVPLPAPVDTWSDSAGLRDLDGQGFSGADNPLVQAALGRPVSGRTVTALRATGTRGSREPLVAIGLPLSGVPGLDSHSLVVLLRCSEQVAVEQAAAWTELRFRDRAVDATGISLTVADAQADDMPLQWANPAFTATTGYSLAEAVGRNCRFLQGPGTDPSAVAELRSALAVGREVTVVLLNYRKDGSQFWNELSISPVVDAAGTLTHLVGVQADVTRRVDSAESVASSALRLAAVAEVSGLMSATLDADEASTRLAEVVVPKLADWVAVLLTSEEGPLAGRQILRHRDGDERALERHRGLVHGEGVLAGPLRDALAGGRSTLLGDDGPGRDRAPAGMSLMVVPLVAQHRVLGAMVLGQDRSGRVFGPADLDVANDIGVRAGTAMHNARLYTREHQVALALQRELLPRLPSVPGLAVAAQYLPARRGDQVGGDWWDVFALPDGATALAVGDVVGHDVAAAAAMGQLRSVLRTCAWAGDAPSMVLARMDQLLQNFDMAQLATCAYARIEPSLTGARLRWANAGHLPPLLLNRRGEPRLLRDALSVPLGVPYGVEGDDAVIDLPPGSTLLLYTDGLVETRDGDIESDLERLLNAVAHHVPADGPQALVDRLVAGIGASNEDDIALLAVQLPCLPVVEGSLSPWRPGQPPRRR